MLFVEQTVKLAEKKWSDSKLVAWNEKLPNSKRFEYSEIASIFSNAEAKPVKVELTQEQKRR